MGQNPTTNHISHNEIRTHTHKNTFPPHRNIYWHRMWFTFNITLNKMTNEIIFLRAIWLSFATLTSYNYIRALVHTASNAIKHNLKQNEASLLIIQMPIIEEISSIIYADSESDSNYICYCKHHMLIMNTYYRNHYGDREPSIHHTQFNPYRRVTCIRIQIVICTSCETYCNLCLRYSGHICIYISIYIYTCIYIYAEIKHTIICSGFSIQTNLTSTKASQS